MGAWSGEPFGNDTAADWAWELDDADDWSIVEEALDDALVDGPVDEDVAMIAIAAAAVVARRLGGPAEGEPDEDDSVEQFVARMDAPSDAIVGKARAALAAATGPQSGLTELWEESGSGGWTDANAQVRDALG